jgi:hypothetical protein
MSLFTSAIEADLDRDEEAKRMVEAVRRTGSEEMTIQEQLAASFRQTIRPILKSPRKIQRVFVEPDSLKTRAPRKHMEELFLALKREGESANAIALLKTLDSRKYMVSSAVGKVARDILISHVGDVDIENEYFPPFAISYASDHQEGDAEGQGPGIMRNYQVSTAFVERGQMLPMSGMLIRVGNFVKAYLKCLNYKNMATTLGKPAAKVLVVLLSNALIRSAACLVEIHTAMANNIPLVLLPLEDRLHWEATEGFSEPWPLEKCQPFLASYFPDWTLATFAQNKGTVLGHLYSENTYPPPGAVATAWEKDCGKDLMDWVVNEAARKAGLTENKPLAKSPGALNAAEEQKKEAARKRGPPMYVEMDDQSLFVTSKEQASVEDNALLETAQNAKLAEGRQHTKAGNFSEAHGCFKQVVGAPTSVSTQDEKAMLTINVVGRSDKGRDGLDRALQEALFGSLQKLASKSHERTDKRRIFTATEAQQWAGSDGWAGIEQAMRAGVTALDLSNNSLNAEGAEVFAELLARCVRECWFAFFLSTACSNSSTITPAQPWTTPSTSTPRQHPRHHTHTLGPATSPASTPTLSATNGR